MPAKKELSDSELEIDHQKSSPKKRLQRVWTENEMKLLCQLRNQGSKWSDIASRFSDCTVSAAANCYSRRGQEMTEAFDSETDALLKNAIENHHKRYWQHIGDEINRSAAGCKKRAMELGYPSKA